MLAEDGVLRLKFITPFLLSGVTVELPLNEELDVSILATFSSPAGKLIEPETLLVSIVIMNHELWVIPSTLVVKVLPTVLIPVKGVRLTDLSAAYTVCGNIDKTEETAKIIATKLSRILCFILLFYFWLSTSLNSIMFMFFKSSVLPLFL